MIYFLIGTIIVSTILILGYKTNRFHINLAEEEKTRREEMELNLNKEFQNRRKEQDKYLSQELTIKKQSIQNEIDDWTKSAQEAASFNQYLQEQKENEYLNDLKNSEQDIYDNIEQLINQQKEINSQLKNAKQSITTYNEAIVQQRKIQEEKDFYRIQLSEAAIHDINYLLSILEHFNNSQIIYKLIWSEYIQKPFKEMLNRVLGNSDPKNVIYMIQNIETHEIYIGKTKSEVSKRWTEHIKTSLNIGGQSPKRVHKAMFKNWNNFSFTVLERVQPSQDLSERESFYIKFYESNVFGYNMIE